MSLTKKLRVTDGSGFRFKRVDPGDTHLLRDEAAGRALRDCNREALLDLQQRLYAARRHSLLLIFQALDTGGKDSTIRDVLSGVDPQGCQVAAFKQPSDEELDHDFMWRCLRRLPERGKIGIFNRSYYEDVLVPRVHPKVLAAQRLPSTLVSKQLWTQRLHDIRAIERYLTRNGVVICKFFLHISKSEQRRRQLARLDDRSKNWKFSLGDLHERRVFDDYLGCYQEAIAATASEHAPWYVIPADHKWFAHAAVSDIVVHALRDLGLEYPHIDARVISRARGLLGARRKRVK